MLLTSLLHNAAAAAADVADSRLTRMAAHAAAALVATGPFWISLPLSMLPGT